MHFFWEIHVSIHIGEKERNQKVQAETTRANGYTNNGLKSMFQEKGEIGRIWTPELILSTEMFASSFPLIVLSKVSILH